MEVDKCDYYGESVLSPADTFAYGQQVSAGLAACMAAVSVTGRRWLCNK
jgi:hypothetical protein